MNIFVNFCSRIAACAVRLYRIKKACRPQPARLRYCKGYLYKTFMIHMSDKVGFSSWPHRNNSCVR